MKAVVQWVLKTMMKDQTGVMRTLPKKDLVDFNVAITAERLARNGIDPNALKNANQVENAINQIEAPRNQKTIGEARGIRSTESAKVFNIEGKELDPKKPIMGGTQTGKELSPELSERLRGTEVDRIKQKIADKKVETEEEILARLNKDNKKNIDKIKNREMIAEAIDNASPGFVKGDRKYNAQLVADSLAEKRFGKEFYDLDQKQQIDLYSEALDGLSDSKNLERQFFKDVEEAGGMEEFLNKNPIDDDSGDFAQGGRAGYASGGITALKSLLNYFAKQRGTKGSQQLKDINPKSVPSGILNLMGPEHRKTLEKNQTDYLESLLSTIKSDKKFLDRNKEIAKQVQKDIDEAGFGDLTTAEKMLQRFIVSAMKGDRLDRMKVYDKINVDDAIVDIEQMIKNRRIKESDGRALNAKGGRIGLKAGMTKRAFLKLMGTGAAGIAALKSGIFSGFGKGAGKQVAKEVVKKSTSTPPPYFFNLAEKIKTLGKVSDGPQERVKIHSMPAKDGKSELMLTEDISTGEMQIKKISKENDEMVSEVQTMEYTPGMSQADETTKGIPADSYNEYTEFNSRIYKDEFNDPDVVDGIKVDEIIEEVKDQALPIKKASGGVAYMLGE